MIRKLRDKRAQVLIETAFFIGIIVLLFFAVFQLGLGYLYSYKLSQVAREAARYASVVPRLEDAAQSQAWLSLRYRIDKCLIALNIDPDEVDRSITWGHGGEVDRGDIIRVVLSMDYPVVLDINMPFIQDLALLRVRGSATAERLI
ncbi:MAG: pilus assembly protein [Candidatus Omnitrophica bacterium]|nr:pilus assembly protein [Candidatus Omnitrophota bacterium]